MPPENATKAGWRHLLFLLEERIGTIVVFTKQLEDRSRKIMEILEGEDFRDGQLVSHTLYKFEVEDNVTDRDGNVRVVGHHRKVGLISDTLKKRLLDNGISNKELAEFMQPPKEVD